MLLQIFAFFLSMGLNPSLERSGKETVSLNGKVVDETGIEGVPGATITIEGLGIETFTDFEGDFSIKNITPGSYSIKISYPSYKTVEIDDFSVSESETDLLINLQ